MNAIFPSPAVAAVAIDGLLQNAHNLDDADHVRLVNSPEPYRAAATLLGWGAADGTDWWSAVMDLIG